MKESTKAVWNADFSLALFNRSGKYFLGKRIIEGNPDLIGGVWYWRYRSARTPAGVSARVLGKLEHLEKSLAPRSGLPGRRAAARRDRRWLHLDPLTVLDRPAGPGDVVVCHDVGPVTNPELFSEGLGQRYDLAYRNALESGMRFVFVSKASQAAFAALYGDPARAQVIYPMIREGVESREHEPVEPVTRPFLLTVGAIGERKNQARCIEAFARSGLAGEGVEYVICGSKEPGHGRVEALAGATQGIRLLPYVTDAQLRWLYANAAGFVLMSRLEGFGLPVAEAMRNDLPLLVSEHSVLQEVAGETALVADPGSTGSIAAGMQELVAQGPLRPSERDLVRTHLRSFSQERFDGAWRYLLLDNEPGHG